VDITLDLVLIILGLFLKIMYLCKNIQNLNVINNADTLIQITKVNRFSPYILQIHYHGPINRV